MAPGQVTEEALPIGEAFQKLVQYTGETPARSRVQLAKLRSIIGSWRGEFRKKALFHRARQI